MGKWTNPRNIQKDVRRKILKAAEALIEADVSEAYHQLYSIADPSFATLKPWEAISHGIGDALKMSSRFPDDSTKKEK